MHVIIACIIFMYHQGRKILEKLLVDLERVFREEGSYINKPLTLSSETFEYISNKLVEIKGVPGSATQSTNSSMGLSTGEYMCG